MTIPFTLVRSKRKTVAIHITREGRVELRCPRQFPQREAERIIRDKAPWIEKQLQKCQSAQAEPPYTPEEIAGMKAAALPLVRERVAYFAPLIGVSYGKLSVKAPKTLWGSCSRQGNLSFHCLLSQVPPEILDYVTVHELCHRRHMNHSPAFWAEVARVLPDYKDRRKWLREEGRRLIGRLP